MLSVRRFNRHKNMKEVTMTVIMNLTRNDLICENDELVTKESIDELDNRIKNQKGVEVIFSTSSQGGLDEALRSLPPRSSLNHTTTTLEMKRFFLSALVAAVGFAGTATAQNEADVWILHGINGTEFTNCSGIRGCFIAEHRPRADTMRNTARTKKREANVKGPN